MAPVWTGYRWEEPAGSDRWRYVDGVGDGRCSGDGVCFGLRGSHLQPGLTCAGTPSPTQDHMAVLAASGATLAHQPILVPPNVKTLRFELRVSGRPSGFERLRVLFAGAEIWNGRMARYNSGCFEQICVDLTRHAGQVGELHFEYSGGNVDVHLDNIRISFNPCWSRFPRVVVNEIWAADPGSDDVEFIELAGEPETRLEGVSLIVVDGDTGGDNGSDDFLRLVYRFDFTPCGALSPDGRLVLGSLDGVADVYFPVDTLENGSQTYALVRTVDIEVVGQRLTEASAAAIADHVIDAVGTKAAEGDHVYFGAPAVVRDGSSAGFMYRFPDGEDSDRAADWRTQSAVEYGDYGDLSTPGAPNTDEVPRRLFVRGDANARGEINISSGIFLLSWLFLGGPEPPCKAAADTDGDGALDISTVVYTFSYLFGGGSPPPAPWPECGPGDPESDGVLGCESFPPCE